MVLGRSNIHKQSPRLMLRASRTFKSLTLWVESGKQRRHSFWMLFANIKITVFKYTLYGDISGVSWLFNKTTWYLQITYFIRICNVKVTSRFYYINIELWNYFNFTNFNTSEALIDGPNQFYSKQISTAFLSQSNFFLRKFTVTFLIICIQNVSILTSEWNEFQAGPSTHVPFNFAITAVKISMKEHNRKKRNNCGEQVAVLSNGPQKLSN